jgi:hypothetical protein
MLAGNTGVIKAYRLVEDLSEDEQENCVQEVDHSDRNVEGVHLLVHVGAHDAHADQEQSFDDEESHSLDNASFLAETDEHSLDEEVDENRDDEEVRSGLELHVEEAPLVEGDRVRVENVGRALVHGDTPACEANDLCRCPCQNSDHSEDSEYGQSDNRG